MSATTEELQRLPTIKIRTSAAGTCLLEINGRPVFGVDGWQLSGGTGGPAELVMYVRGFVEIDGFARVKHDGYDGQPAA
jgi:hypothetical protein